MKTIIIFIGLKILEIVAMTAIIAVLYFIGFCLIGKEDDDLTGIKFMRVLAGFVLVGGCALFACLIYLAVIANWEWALRLSG